jgi:hypothetical protein
MERMFLLRSGRSMLFPVALFSGMQGGLLAAAKTLLIPVFGGLKENES